MVTDYRSTGRRCGAIAPLTCVLLVLILGMVAFAVDVSYMVLTAAELQNVADSAAMAGANKLGDSFVLYSMPTQTTANKTTLRSGAVTTATSTAQTYATYNNAGGVRMTLLSSDIECGYTDSTGAYTSYSSNNTNYPNTVKVTARRDSSANNPLSLFFAPVLGISTMNMTATATASLYAGTINSFKVGTVNSGMLPVALDVNDWNTFVRTGADKGGNINRDASGNPQMQIYGTVNQSPQLGNFGLISLNDSHVGSSTINSWIDNGMRPSDVQALLANGLIPLSSHNANSWDWLGETGFQSDDAQSINDYVGKTFMLPLYKPYVPSNDPSIYQAGVGNGSSFAYNIVQFVGVKIMPANRDNREVWIQPADVSDPNMILTGVALANGNGSTTSIYTSTTVKLTK